MPQTSEAKSATVSGVITQIRTTDIEESIEFYTSLGFELDFRFQDFYAGIRVGDQPFHLKLVDDKDPAIEYVSKGDHFHLYFPTDDAESKAAELRKKGITPRSGINTTEWGSKEFSITDNQGHILYFAENPD